MKRIAWVIAAIMLTGCGGSPTKGDRPSFSVSIEPIGYIVGQIAGDDFAINVLVPPGASPETYEPTATQMRELTRSTLYVSIGLIDFEQNLNRMAAKDMPQVRLVRLDKGIGLIEGSGHDQDYAHDAHHHGVDPHIWLSLRAVKQMAETVADELTALYPDSTKYRTNYETFAGKLDTADAELAALFAGRSVSFMIYHPALTYMARDYGLNQIAIEDEGKEPAADHIRRLIDVARSEKITKIFYQSQFSWSTVRALTEELGIEAVPFDPVATDVVENIRSIGREIAAP